MDDQIRTTVDEDGLQERDAMLDRLAQVSVRVGLNLAHGQQLVMTAPLEAAPLARRITEQAYKAGASLVTCLYADGAAARSRFRFAPDDAFDTAATWLADGVAEAFRTNVARLSITGEDPALLSDEDPERIARANRANARANQAALGLITNFAVNWNIVACATPAWARTMFPGEPESEALLKLWAAIFAASRLDGPDPVSEWQAHDARLHARAESLTRRRYQALHFRGPGTDLVVGLAEGHRWLGGSGRAANGIICLPNIPTEEVFTTPHKDRVHGHVRSTKPLSYQGTLIEGIAVRFEAGRIVDARASRGGTVLERVLGTDDGARRLGEVALVPHSSPISQSGLLFQNTLFDENAASHIALGQAYSTCLEGGGGLDADSLAARGANSSLIHIDWMIGSGEIDVDGVGGDGVGDTASRTPLMRGGEWVDAV